MAGLVPAIHVSGVTDIRMPGTRPGMTYAGTRAIDGGARGEARGPMGTEGRLGRILRTFLAGVLALLPIAVTLFVIGWVASLIASYAGPGSFVGRFITTLGTSLGLDIEPSSTRRLSARPRHHPRRHLCARRGRRVADCGRWC